jgi:hypothetical protein
MWSFRDSRDEERRQTILTFTLGAVGGLAIGMLLSSRAARRAAREVGGEFRERVGYAADRFGGTALEDPALSSLEDAVLDAFLDHDILRERPIDVGAVSRGIIELSGSVWTEEEADLAVRVANGVREVQTVVNRLEVESEAQHLEETRRRFEDGDPALHETRWEGRIVGMGRMRQGQQTEPDRPDDSQHQRERALREADRDQWQEEELGGHENTRIAARPEAERPGQQPDFEHDELDNQDPHRRHHAPHTLDEPPQELRSGTRVGDGLKPGRELDLEDADVPVKPHGDPSQRGRGGNVL